MLTQTDPNLQIFTTKHVSKNYPQCLLDKPFLWSVLAKQLFLSVLSVYFCLFCLFCSVLSVCSVLFCSVLSVLFCSVCSVCLFCSVCLSVCFCLFCLSISVCSVCSVANTIFSLKQGQGLKTSVAQLYPNSPLVHPPLPDHM